MARLTAAARRALPAKAFAGPNRSYPIPDASHATFAKAMATQHAGPALKSRIDAAVAAKFPKKKKPSLGGQLTAMRGAGQFKQPGGGVLKGVQARGGY
jgi:hypothetical protein